MKQLFVYMAMCFTILFVGSINAEEMICPPSYSCVLSVDKKIQKSYEEANLILKGKFKMEEKPQLKSLGNDLSVVENIQFDIDEVIKGSFNREFVEFRLTVVKPRDLHGEVEGKSRVDDFEKIEQSFYDLERSYEKGSVGEAQYLNRLNVLNENLLDVVDRSSGKVFLVPVKVGGLDNFYREVNVPVKLGREYYVFIFRGFSEGVLFPWDLDVYPVEKYKAWIPAYSN